MQIDPKLQRQISLSAHIQPLMEPLELLKVDFLRYDRIFSDGGRFSLCSHVDWLLHYYQQRYYEISKFARHPTSYSNQIVFWDFKDESHPSVDVQAQDAQKNFNIRFVLSEVKELSDGLEIFHFGSSNNTRLVSHKLLENLDLVERYIHYFRVYILAIEAEMRDNRILNEYFKRKENEQDIAAFQVDHQLIREKFLDATPLDVIILGGQYTGVTITHKEAKCLRLAINGFTMKESSGILHMSDRTVENHLNSLRNKLNINTKKQLIELFETDKYLKRALSYIATP